MPLFGIKVTRFDKYDVLGLHWAHILGDGAAFNRFTHLLSRAYAGEPPLAEDDWPDHGEHVYVNEAPSEDVHRRWDSAVYHPAWEQAEAGRACEWRAEGRGAAAAELPTDVARLTRVQGWRQMRGPR